MKNISMMEIRGNNLKSPFSPWISPDGDKHSFSQACNQTNPGRMYVFKPIWTNWFEDVHS